MSKYSESAMGYRRQLPGIASMKGDGYSTMVTLDADITVPRDSTSFIGRATTGGKMVLVDGANTSNKIMGYLDAGKFESDKNIANLRKLDAYNSFTLKTGETYPLWKNAGMQFRIQIAATGTPGANETAVEALARAQRAAIAALKVGQTYNMKVVSGVQQLDGSAAGTQLTYIGPAGGGYVIVEIAPGV